MATPLVFLTENHLEAAVVTASPSSSAAILARLFDRDRGPQYGAGNLWSLIDVFPLAMSQVAPALVDIDFDLGSAKAVTAWAGINHNVAGVTQTLFGKSTFPPTDTIDSFTPTGVDFIRTFGSQSLRFWRLRVPALALGAHLKIGEFMLGGHITLSGDAGAFPFIESTAPASLGNVRRDRSVGGYSRKTKLGAPRARLPYTWTGIGDADLALLKLAWDQADQGAKNFVHVDGAGVVRWMEFTTPDFAPKSLGGGNSELALTLEEAL
jgi:hypothetical protein